MGTKGHLSIYLLAAVFAAASVGASAAPPKGYTLPACTLSDATAPKVTDDNGHEVLESLYKTAWQQFTACVESGKAVWINAAFALHPFSDGAVAEDIDSSLGEALGNNPKQVIETAVKAGATWELQAICAGVDFDDPRFDSYASSMAEIDRRQKALARATHPDLQPQMDECRAELEQSKSNIEVYFRDGPFLSPDPGTVPPPPRSSEPRSWGDFVTSPAAHPVPPAGPPAKSRRQDSRVTTSPAVLRILLRTRASLCCPAQAFVAMPLTLRGRSPTAQQSFAFTARPDPGTVPPQP